MIHTLPIAGTGTRRIRGGIRTYIIATLNLRSAIEATSCLGWFLDLGLCKPASRQSLLAVTARWHFDAT